LPALHSKGNSRVTIGVLLVAWLSITIPGMKPSTQPHPAKPSAVSVHPSFFSLLIGAAMILSLFPGTTHAQTRTTSFPIRSGSGAFDIH
jgi:hypothetical protein